ncbi:MAG: hypothetical protein VXY33_06440 [Verrucomicrobiota bacterium]|nr:hypothetical protein [Verrucomicrobiota bacterium]
MHKRRHTSRNTSFPINEKSNSPPEIQISNNNNNLGIPRDTFKPRRGP